MAGKRQPRDVEVTVHIPVRVTVKEGAQPVSSKPYPLELVVIMDYYSATKPAQLAKHVAARLSRALERLSAEEE